MTDKKIKQAIKEVVTKLADADLEFTIEDELSFAKNRIKYLEKSLKDKRDECKDLEKEKAEIKKYLGISTKTIMQRLEELQERKDELSEREDKYKQALYEIEKFMIYEFSGQNQWVKKNVLDIINKAKE